MSTRKPIVLGTVVQPDARDQLRRLAEDMDTTVSHLARLGLVMVLARHGEAPPASLAHLLTEQDRAYLVRCGITPGDLPACTDIGSSRVCTDSELTGRTDTAVPL